MSKPGIYGIALNGKNGTQAINDTDGGELDKDTVFDRAVGSMQFIPSTWQVVKVDADGDSKRNPQDIDDAALASAVYLCSGKDNLSQRKGQEAAVYRYNHSQDYVNLVLRIMEAYSSGDYSAVPSGAQAGTSFSSSSSSYSSAIDQKYKAAKQREARQRAAKQRRAGSRERRQLQQLRRFHQRWHHQRRHHTGGGTVPEHGGGGTGGGGDAVGGTVNKVTDGVKKTVDGAAAVAAAAAAPAAPVQDVYTQAECCWRCPSRSCTISEVSPAASAALSSELNSQRTPGHRPGVLAFPAE